MGVTAFPQNLLKLPTLLLTFKLESHQSTTDPFTSIDIVEITDVRRRLHSEQKIVRRSGPFRKFEFKEKGLRHHPAPIMNDPKFNILLIRHIGERNPRLLQFSLERLEISLSYIDPDNRPG